MKLRRNILTRFFKGRNRPFTRIQAAPIPGLGPPTGVAARRRLDSPVFRPEGRPTRRHHDARRELEELLW